MDATLARSIASADAPQKRVRRARVGQGAALVHRPEYARGLLESRLLPPGSDLKRTFVVAMLDHIDGGWLLGEFSSTGAVFFCTRGAERLMVSITPCAPDHVHKYGAAHLTESPGRDD
jgi:hypothetical protein